MSERLNTRGLAEHLANQTGMDRKRAEEFIDALSLYFMQGLERNKAVKISGLGVFKIILVRERESIHIQTGERFAIPAHHKITFQPDKEFKEQINRPFALFEPIEATESELLAVNQQTEEADIRTLDEADSRTLEEAKTTVQEDISDYLTETFLPDDDASINNETDTGTPFDGFVESPPLNGGMYTYDEPFEPPPLNGGAEMYGDEPFEQPPLNGGVETYDEPFEQPPLNGGVEMYDEPFEQPPLNGGAETYDEPFEQPPLNGSIKTEDEIISPVPENRKKKGHLWLVLAVVSISCILGSGMGLYWFLQTNSEKLSKEQQTTQTTEISELTDENTDHSPPSLVDFSGDDQSNNPVPPPVSGDQLSSNPSSTGSSTDSEKTVDRNWLTPLPDNAKTPIQRADRPNQEIEARNRALANNTRQTPATAATSTAAPATSSNTATLPARIRIQAGSTLMQLALDYYGDKVFWVYIYQHNQNSIKNFNNIPIGTELLLPEAKTYGIDSKNAASKDRALQIQRQLMRQ